MDWTLFENLDRLRRQQGALLDALGLGPVEAPYREVFRAPGVSLRRYGSGDESGPLVLIVPAPIKRPYIWDLAPEVSAVRRCCAWSIRAAAWCRPRRCCRSSRPPAAATRPCCITKATSACRCST